MPPWPFWLIPLVVAALRAIPFLAGCATAPAEGQVRIPVGYNPTDFSVYASLVRSASEHFSFTLENPFTTFPQDGRYLMPLFSLLGGLGKLTGLGPFSVLEWSRTPLIFLFFGTLWWFLAPIFSCSKDRMLACVLVAFSGGIEYLVMPFISHFPAEVADVAGHDLSNAFGWTSFASCYNPLWLAGLTGTLVALRPLFEPARPASFGAVARLGLGAVLAYVLHPYSGMVVIAVIALLPCVAWFSGRAPEAKSRLVVHTLTLLLVALCVGTLGWWQSRDTVYRLTAQNVFGKWDVPVFWYPVGLGLIGLLALFGWRDLLRNKAPLSVPLATWTLAVMALHSSPVLNGFHFVFHLHLPICIAATPPFRRFLETSQRTAVGSLLRWGMLTGLFASALYTTYVSATGALSFQAPADSVQIAKHLGTQPRGNVWASPELSNLIPAYSGQFVYAGHWFLTPGWGTKKSLYDSFIKGEMLAGEITRFFANEKIRYAVVPKNANQRFLEELAAQSEARREFTDHTLFLLRQSGRGNGLARGDSSTGQALLNPHP